MKKHATYESISQLQMWTLFFTNTERFQRKVVLFMILAWPSWFKKKDTSGLVDSE